MSLWALIIFFILGSTVSAFGKKRKAQATALHERKGARSITQVLANGLPPLIMAALFYLTGRKACLLAVFACLAAATADTFSSEIGMLSKKDPVSILTRKKVQRGMSGGVTFLGLMGALVGASLISILVVPQFGITGMAAVILAGLADSLLDSVMGEALQAKYEMPCSEENTVQHLTEHKTLDGAPLKLVRGISWMNNDVVNFTSAFVCGLAVAIIW